MWKDCPGMNSSFLGLRLPLYFVILLFSQKGHRKNGVKDGSFAMPSTTRWVFSSVEGDMCPYLWCHSSKFLRSLERPVDQVGGATRVRLFTSYS